MAAIKRFFEKRKLDVKFKRAGEGHRLDVAAGNTSPSHEASSDARPVRGSDLTREQRMAADAAVARLNQPKAGKKPDHFFGKEKRRPGLIPFNFASSSSA